MAEGGGGEAAGAGALIDLGTKTGALTAWAGSDIGAGDSVRGSLWGDQRRSTRREGDVRDLCGL